METGRGIFQFWMPFQEAASPEDFLASVDETGAGYFVENKNPVVKRLSDHEAFVPIAGQFLRQVRTLPGIVEFLLLLAGS